MRKMKKALFVNAVCGIRSTGRIVIDCARELEKEGYEVKIAYSRENVPQECQNYAVRIGNKIDVYWHAFMTYVFDQRGLWSRNATRRFLKWADEFNPDVLWLHNIHDYVINLKLLFEWIKSRPQMEVRWTQHDCWAFTGGCMHFVTRTCDQWKTHCVKCPKKEVVQGMSHLPVVHREEKNYNQKKRLFTKVKKMKLVAPSQWMADQIRQSFLGEYPIEVHYNTVDLGIFKPTDSSFRKKYGLENKKIILGVASAWSRSKGLFDFYKLSEILDNSYQIVLVGLTPSQLKSMPCNIIGIERTDSKQELAEIYSAADVFFNPTYADTYPTVNLEAEACDTRVITYRTGGSPETLSRQDSVVIEQGQYQDVVKYMEGVV